VKPFLLLVFLALSGCGDLLDGIRIGTDETSSGSSEENPGYQAVCRAADFARFPGDRDSLVASASVGAGSELVVPASPSPLLLSLWSRDSALGAWVRDPTSNFPPVHASFVVSITLTDSVTHEAFELSVAGTGIASSGTRIDSSRTVHRLRSPGGLATLAVRWTAGDAWRIATIDSVPMDRDGNIDVSGLPDLPSGSRFHLDSTGAIAGRIGAP
jgi:hypothetical protein